MATDDQVKVTFKISPRRMDIECNLPLEGTGTAIVKKLFSDSNLKIPRKDAQNNDIEYKLWHKKFRTEIGNKELRDVGVKDVDYLYMQPSYSHKTVSM